MQKFKEANPDLEVSVVLNEGTPTELFDGAPWVKEVYSVNPYGFLKELRKTEEIDFDSVLNDHSTLEQIPKEWDFVMTDERALADADGRTDLWIEEEGMVNFHKLAKEYFVAREGRGRTFHTRVLPDGLEYDTDARVDLQIPEEIYKKVVKEYDAVAPKLCILPGGSAGINRYPSIKSWVKIIHALKQGIPDLAVYLTGVHQTANTRTDTRAYTKQDIQKMVEATGATDCFNKSLWEQVSLLKFCDVFMSPHSGFAFLAPCVGTPWLALSGGPWPEYFFNQVSFYSILPDNLDYPYMHEFIEEDHPDKIPSMKSDALAAKILEIVEAFQLLIDTNFTYKDALERHRKNIEKANVKKERIPKVPGF